MFGKEGEMKNTLDCLAYLLAFVVVALAYRAIVPMLPAGW